MKPFLKKIILPLSFKGLNILITAGPTREMWDTVRYLSNLSSGKTGLAIAKTAVKCGANVTLISSKYGDLHGINFIYAESAVDMFEKVKRELGKCKIFISAAAVADFRPVKMKRKIKKRDELPVIKLKRNPDILKWAAEKYPDKLLVGFSLEDKIDVEKGLLKKKEKNCSVMVLNDVQNLGSDIKTIALITDKGINEYKDLSLEEMAEVILEQCQKLM